MKYIIFYLELGTDLSILNPQYNVFMPASVVFNSNCGAQSPQQSCVWVNVVILSIVKTKSQTESNMFDIISTGLLTSLYSLYMVPIMT